MGVIPDWHSIDYSLLMMYMCHSLSRRCQQLGGEGGGGGGGGGLAAQYRIISRLHQGIGPE